MLKTIRLNKNQNFIPESTKNTILKHKNKTQWSNSWSPIDLRQKQQKGIQETQRMKCMYQL